MQTKSDKPELRLTLFTDYICPFCYIGDLRLEKLRAHFNLLINFRFIEIHPDTPLPGADTQSLQYPENQWSDMMDGLLEMAKAEGINLQPPAFIANSHHALLVAEAAKQAGREIFYRLNRKLFESYFLEGRNLGDDSVLMDIGKASGVGQSMIENAWSDPAYEAVLHKNMAMAIQAGVTGTPTFFIGKHCLTGAVETSVLFDAARSTIADQPRAE